jgi:hypothetical protein
VLPPPPPLQVLRFYCCWAPGGGGSSGATGGGGVPGVCQGPLPYVLHYFLGDDCVEVREVHPRNDGREPFPMLLSKRRLPKALQPIGGSGRCSPRVGDVPEVEGAAGRGRCAEAACQI